MAIISGFHPDDLSSNLSIRSKPAAAIAQQVEQLICNQ